MFPGFINRVLLQNKSRHNVTYYPWLLWQNWVGSYKRDLCPQPHVHIMGPVPEHVPTSVTGRGLSPLGNGLIRLMTQNPSVGGPGGSGSLSEPSSLHEDALRNTALEAKQGVNEHPL